MAYCLLAVNCVGMVVGGELDKTYSDFIQYHYFLYILTVVSIGILLKQNTYK